MSVTPDSFNPLCPDYVENPRSIPGVSPLARRLLPIAFGAATMASPSCAASLALNLFTIPSRDLLGRRGHLRSLSSTARAFRLRKSGFDLQMYEWAGAGPRVILTHGWSSHVLRLAPLIESLRRADFSVLAFDAPGHGASGGVRSSFPCFRRALRAVLDWAGGADAVVAHSLGARAAMTLLASPPSSPKVGRLVLLAPPRDVRYMFEQFKLVLSLRPDVCQLLEERLVEYLGEPLDQHRADDMRRLNIPTLLVHDAQDDVAPVRYARHLARHLHDARLLVTSGLNHCGVLCDEQVIRVLLRFLQRHCRLK